MAVWQFSLQLVPSATLAAHPAWIENSFTDDGFLDTEGWWDGIPIPDNLEAEIDKFLPRGHNWWNAEEQLWGTENGHRLLLAANSELIEDIALRLDLRELDIAVVKKSRVFAATLDCRFYDLEARKVVDPNPEELLSAIQESSAARFVEDPQAFFAAILKNPID